MIAARLSPATPADPVLFNLPVVTHAQRDEKLWG